MHIWDTINLRPYARQDGTLRRVLTIQRPTWRENGPSEPFLIISPVEDRALLAHAYFEATGRELLDANFAHDAAGSSWTFYDDTLLKSALRTFALRLRLLGYLVEVDLCDDINSVATA
jgi:hypothetical protein